MTVETAALPPLAARLRGVRSSPVRDILALTEQPGVISFAGGLPAPELFDGPGTRAAFAAALHDAAVGRTLQYSTTEGDPALRAAVAARLTARGLPTHADELLITSGSQQALTLIATVLLEPGDTVLVEEPSYLAALQAFQLAGATVVPVPCDDDGIDPEAAAALAARHGARLLYTIPTFQNPTGRTLPLERREALVALARGAGFWLLEDDPYGELRYRGEPLPTLAALDDRVLSLSTLSKIAAPGLRIGWVRAPEPLRRPLTIAKQAADLHSSTVDQAAAAHWLEHDRPRRARRPRCARSTARAATRCSTGSRDALPPGSAHNRPDGGMFVWARLPDGWDAGELLDRALAPRGRVRAGLSVLRRAARPGGAAAVVHRARPGGDRRGARAAARGLGRLGRVEAVEVALQRDPHRLVDRQRDPQRQRQPRAAAPALAGEALRQAGERAERDLVRAVAADAVRARVGLGGEAGVEQHGAAAAAEPDEPAGGGRADRRGDAGAAQQLDAEHRQQQRVGAARVEDPVEPQHGRVEAGVGLDEQVALEHGAEAPRAVRPGHRGDAEQPARRVVEPPAGGAGVDGPELGRERQQQLARVGARSVGELGEGGQRVHLVDRLPRSISDRGSRC